MNSQKREVNKEILISKVFLKNAIWDKRLKDHSNRNIVDKAWREIAVEMDVEDDGMLRKKWKYLRDQFAIEVGKIPPPRSGDSGDRPESKWPYFNSLKFLLGIVKPRTSSSNLRSNSSEHQDQNIELVAHNDSSETEGFQEMESPETHGQQHTQPDDSTRTNSESLETFSRKRKRTGVNAQYNQKILSLEEKKASLLERVINERECETDNEDALFFRSLLPHVSNIPQHLKLRFRNGVQQLVEEFAYGSNCPVESSHFDSQPGQSIPQYTAEYISLSGSHTTTDSNNS